MPPFSRTHNSAAREELARVRRFRAHSLLNLQNVEFDATASLVSTVMAETVVFK
jgi:hypothetical protein